MTCSVLPTLRLWMATLKPLRARLRPRLEPSSAVPATPMSATSAGDGAKLAMGSPQVGMTVEPVRSARADGTSAGGGPVLPPPILGTPGPPCRAVPGFPVTTARAGTVTASPSTAVTGPNESDASDDPSLPRARPVRTRGPSGHRSRRRRRRGRTLRRTGPDTQPYDPTRRGRGLLVTDGGGV